MHLKWTVVLKSRECSDSLGSQFILTELKPGARQMLHYAMSWSAVLAFSRGHCYRRSDLAVLPF
jgi:hypothetical protein